MATSNIRLWALTDSLASVRIKINDSIQALLSTYAGAMPPEITDFTNEAGINPGIPNGVLHWNTANGVLVVNDPARKQAGGLSGNWTRNGIGNRVYSSLTAANANVAYIEQGELVSVINGSNTRLYMKTNGTTGWIDVGTPAPDSITGTMFADRTIANTKIAEATITEYEIASRTLSNIKIQSYSLTSHEIKPRSISNLSFISGNITYKEVANYTLTGTNVANSSLPFRTLQTATIGAILYGNAAGAINELVPGSAGQVLKTGGPGGNIYWDQAGLYKTTYLTNSNIVVGTPTASNCYMMGNPGIAPKLNNGIAIFNTSYTPIGTDSNLLVEWCVYGTEVTTAPTAFVTALFVSNFSNMGAGTGSDIGANGSAVSVGVVGLVDGTQYSPQPCRGSHLFKMNSNDTVYLQLKWSADTAGSIIINAAYNQSTWITPTDSGMVSWLRMTEIG